MKFATHLATFILGLALAGLILPTWVQKEPPEKERSDEVDLEMLGSITGKKFPLQKVIADTSGSSILKPEEAHQPLLNFIQSSAQSVSTQLSRPDSPAREKRRINEVSALFEDALRILIDQHSDFSCEFPKTKAGESQRSGYPDLRVEHLPSGSVAYLDPKLFEAKSIKSTFRTFYFEPSQENSKVTEDALHLLVGFPHDGKTGEWTFAKPHLVDLFDLTVKLKTEFSASNKDLYSPAE